MWCDTCEAGRRVRADANTLREAVDADANTLREAVDADANTLPLVAALA